MNLEKFKLRNQFSIDTLNLYIEDNKKDISRLVASATLICWLALLEGVSTDEVDVEQFSYKKIRVVYDAYYPDFKLGILMKDMDIKFDIPCVCGIYNDEDHNIELK